MGYKWDLDKFLIDKIAIDYEGVLEVYKMKRICNKIPRISNIKLFENVPLVKQLKAVENHTNYLRYLTDSCFPSDIIEPFSYFSDAYIDKQVFPYLSKDEIVKELSRSICLDYLLLCEPNYLGKLILETFVKELQQLSINSKVDIIEEIINILRPVRKLNNYQQKIIQDFPELKLGLLNI